MARRIDKQQHAYDYPRPMVTVDVVVLTPVDDRLRVLLIRRGRSPFKGHWALPGGFVDMDESLTDAARRELAEETGLRLPKSAGRSARGSTNVWLDQLRSFGQPDRDPRGRVITVVYLAVIRPGHAPEVIGGDDADEAAWFNVYRLPKLAFDHRDIIRCALDRLRTSLECEGLGFRLVPVEFTLDELQHAHEMVLRRRLNRRRFRREVRALGGFEPSGQRRRDRTGRVVPLYRYRPA